MQKCATQTFNSATVEETIEKLLTSELPEGGKFERNFPGARDAIAHGFEHYGTIYPNTKWCWRWMLTQLKRNVVPALFDQMDPASHYILQSAHELEQQISQSKDRMEAVAMGRHPRHEGELNEETQRYYMRMEKLKLERVQGQLDAMLAKPVENREKFEQTPIDAVWGARIEGQPSAYNTLRMVDQLTPMIQRYNEKVPLAGITTLNDMWNYRNVLVEKHAEAERIREMKEGFETGDSYWDARSDGDTLYTFPNGWTVDAVRTEHDCYLEGELMDHCVKDDEAEHFQRMTNGLSLGISLRDPVGIPHATGELSPDGRELAYLYGVDDQPLNDKYKGMMNEYFKHSPLKPNSVYWSNPTQMSGRFDYPHFEEPENEDNTDPPEPEYESDDYWWDNDLQPPTYSGKHPFDFLKEMIEWYDNLQHYGHDIQEAATSHEYFEEEGGNQDDYGRWGGIQFTREPVQSPMGGRSLQLFLDQLFQELANGEGTTAKPLNEEQGWVPLEYQLSPSGLEYHDTEREGYDGFVERMPDTTVMPPPQTDETSEGEWKPTVHSTEEIYELAKGMTILEELLSSYSRWGNEGCVSLERFAELENAEANKYPDNEDIDYFMTLVLEDADDLKNGDHYEYPRSNSREQDTTLFSERGHGDTWEPGYPDEDIDWTNETAEERLRREVEYEKAEEEIDTRHDAEDARQHTRTQEEENSLRANSPDARHPEVSIDQAYEGLQSGDFVFRDGRWWLNMMPRLVPGESRPAWGRRMAVRRTARVIFNKRRTATMIFNTATAEEALEQISRSELAPDLKIWRKLPEEARELVLEGFRQYGMAYPESKWGWQWLANFMKKNVLPKMYQEMDADSWEIKNDKEKLQAQKESLLAQIAEATAAEVTNPDDYQRDYEINRLQRQVETADRGMAALDRGVENRREDYATNPLGHMWERHRQTAFFPTLAYLGPIADRYNIPIDFATIGSVRDLEMLRDQIERDVRTREKERKLKEGFADGTYKWEAEPIYTFDDGWTVYPIESRADLKLEGELMDHCIAGGYHTERIERGERKAISLRDPIGIPHVTAEMTGDMKHLDCMYGVQNQLLNDNYAKRMLEFYKQSPLDPDSNYYTREKYTGGQYESGYMDDEFDEDDDNPPPPIEAEDNLWHDNGLEPPDYHYGTPFEFLKEVNDWVKRLRAEGYEVAQTTRTEYYTDEEGYQADNGMWGAIDYTRLPVDHNMDSSDYQKLVSDLFYDIVHGDAAAFRRDGEENEHGPPMGREMDPLPESDWKMMRPSEELYMAAIGLAHLDELMVGLDMLTSQQAYEILTKERDEYGPNDDLDYFINLTEQSYEKLESSDPENFSRGNRDKDQGTLFEPNTVLERDPLTGDWRPDPTEDWYYGDLDENGKRIQKQPEGAPFKPGDKMLWGAYRDPITIVSDDGGTYVRGQTRNGVGDYLRFDNYGNPNFVPTDTTIDLEDQYAKDQRPMDGDKNGPYHWNGYGWVLTPPELGDIANNQDGEIPDIPMYLEDDIALPQEQRQQHVPGAGGGNWIYNQEGELVPNPDPEVNEQDTEVLPDGRQVVVPPNGWQHGDRIGDMEFDRNTLEWHYVHGPRRAHASSGENWVYFDGQVKRGPQPHHTLLNHLTEHMVGEKEPGAIAHAWAAGTHLPLDIPNAVARGSYDKDGRPFFWESNVDRNAVYDAAMQTTAHVKTAVIREAEGDERVYDSMGGTWPVNDLAGTLVEGDRGINSYEDGRLTGSMLYKMVNGMVWVDSIYTVDGTPAGLELFAYLKQAHPGVQIEGMFMNNRLKALADRYNRSLGHTPLTDAQRHEQTGMPPETLEMLRPMFEQANQGRKLEPLNRGTQMMASLGYYETPEEMYGKIQASGWNVVSQGARAGQWVVVIQNQQGGKVERTGRTQEQALASALTWTWQHSHMSSKAGWIREMERMKREDPEQYAQIGSPCPNCGRKAADTEHRGCYQCDPIPRKHDEREQWMSQKTAWDWGTDKGDLQRAQWEEEAPLRERQQKEEWEREEARKEEWRRNPRLEWDLRDNRTDAYTDVPPRKKKEPFVPPPPPEKKPRAPRVKKEPVVEAPVEETPVVETPEENLMRALDGLDAPPVKKPRVKKVAPPIVEEPVVEEPIDDEPMPGLRPAPTVDPNGKSEYWKRRKEHETIDKALRDRAKATTPEEQQAAQEKAEMLIQKRDERAKRPAPPAVKKPNPLNEPVTPKGESFLKRDPNEVPVVKKAPVQRAAPAPKRERTGPPNIAQDAVRNNPGITVEQIAAENGLSVERVRKMLGKKTLGRVLASLRPNEDDGTHFGFEAHSNGYSYDEMERFLSDVKRDEIAPGWASFHRAAKMSYLSRGWRVTSASELRIYDDSLPGGMEKRPVVNLEHSKQEGYWALGNTNCYRATIFDPLSQREVWDSDKEWMKDRPEGVEPESEDNSIVVPDPQMSLFDAV